MARHAVGERSAQLRQPVSRFMGEVPDEGAETPTPAPMGDVYSY
jgi:hypothetical protein